ncbi:MAG: hypothetical protein U9Q61_09925 [Thermodesulfobacteriota bacterium]|nr:hypothetical protein [Thermodesulfobacteriota bacterium]
MNKQQPEPNAPIGGHWFNIGTVLLWGTTGTAQILFDISLIFAGLGMLMLKGRSRIYEITI